jgi:hypothetical protein
MNRPEPFTDRYEGPMSMAHRVRRAEIPDEGRDVPLPRGLLTRRERRSISADLLRSRWPFFESAVNACWLRGVGFFAQAAAFGIGCFRLVPLTIRFA